MPVGQREELLAAAAALFRERGYYGVGMQDIGRRRRHRRLRCVPALRLEAGAPRRDHRPTPRRPRGRCPGDPGRGSRRRRHPRRPRPAPPRLRPRRRRPHRRLPRRGAQPPRCRPAAGPPQAARLPPGVGRPRCASSSPTSARPTATSRPRRSSSLLQSVAWQRPDLPRAVVEARLQQLARGALDIERAPA